MAQQSILTDSLSGSDVVQPNWLYGTSQPGALPPILTARSTSSASPGGLPGVPAGGTADAAGSGALQLTNSSKNQGSFAIYNQPINSSAGLSVKFNLYSYGGTSTGADGISFFLIDGSQSPTTGGAVGGGLGYSADSFNNPSTPTPGIAGGYLGIGFDEYGSFSIPGYGSGGAVQNGTGINGADNTGFAPQSIVLRGSQATGYNYLTGTKLPNGATIDTAGATSRSTSGRLVDIELDNTGKLSVSFDVNGDGTIATDGSETLINNYNVAANNGALPSTFKFGFAASTGNSTNVHSVNNLAINTFDGAYTSLVSFPPVNATLTPNKTLNVTASIDVASTLPVTIPLNLGGTAQQGTDYSLSASSITIAPGQTTGSVTLTDGSAANTNKTIQISLGNPTNAALSPQASTLNVTLAPGNTQSLVLENPATGSSVVWGLNGSQVTPAGFTQLTNGTVVNLDSTWKLVSNNVDFNKDGVSDFVWFNTATTQSAIWYMQAGSNGLNNIIGDKSTFITAPGSTSRIAPGGSWQLDGATTVLGGTPTLIWEDRASGASALWKLDIDSTTGRASVNTATSKLITGADGVTPLKTGGAASGWQIVGAGNFGGSGTQDLLWFNTKSSQTALWQLNGTTLVSAGVIQAGSSAATPGSGWQPVAIASVDGTGTDQIVWQNGTSVAVWAVGSNYTLTSKSALLTQPLAAGEQIQAVADIDLNGTLDLLARNTGSGSDTTRVYTLDPTTFQVTTPTTPRYLTLAGQTAPLFTGDRRWEIIDATLSTAAA